MRRSRKSALGVLALVGALATAFAVVGSAAADDATSGPVTQSLEVKVSPTKLAKDGKKAKPTALKSLDVTVGATANNNTTLPPGSNLVKVGFAKEVVFDNAGVPAADQATIETQTTDQARGEFKNAIVGDGDSVAACGSAGGSFATFPGVVTVFNGTKGKGAKSARRGGGGLKVFLHAVTALPTGPFTTVLVGTLDKKNVLTVPVQPLGGGACSIQTFHADIGKTTKVKKKKKTTKVSYVSSTCPKSKSLEFNAEFNYDPNPYNVSQLSPTDSVTCKPKK